jgi:hypothetical protein
MTHPAAPLGLLSRAARWLKDFAAMPGRIRRLSESAAEDADKRLICRNCGTGRVTNLRTSGGEISGTCSQCRTVWDIAPGAAHLLRPSFHQSHR